jgi:hypothetical protein
MTYRRQDIGTGCGRGLTHVSNECPSIPVPGRQPYQDNLMFCR